VFILTDFTCPEDYIKCEDGLQCIHISSMCTHIRHCNDASDYNKTRCQGQSYYKYIDLLIGV